MDQSSPNLLGVPDMERLIYGRPSDDSRTPRQRRIRRVLRELGEGVGSGSRYQWTDEELRRLTPRVKAWIEVKWRGR